MSDIFKEKILMIGICVTLCLFIAKFYFSFLLWLSICDRKCVKEIAIETFHEEYAYAIKKEKIMSKEKKILKDLGIDSKDAGIGVESNGQRTGLCD